MTKTESECASYEFTTLTCIPGVIDYKGANIQLLDLPGIIEGASQGKGKGSHESSREISEMFLKTHLTLTLTPFRKLKSGRGRQVIAVARTADVVMMMLDATKGDVQRELLEAELETVGIRLNKGKPNIYFKVNLNSNTDYLPKDTVIGMSVDICIIIATIHRSKKREEFPSTLQ